MFRCLCTDPLTLQGWFSLDLNVFFTFFSSSSFPLNSTRVQISSVTVCLTQISSLRLCVWLQGITKTCSEFLFTCKQRLLLQWVLQTWSGQLLKWYKTQNQMWMGEMRDRQRVNQPDDTTLSEEYHCASGDCLSDTSANLLCPVAYWLGL